MNCERCGQAFAPRVRGGWVKRFCSRRCQMNAYFEQRHRTDPEFHQRALEYQRLWRVRDRARRLMDLELNR